MAIDMSTVTNITLNNQDVTKIEDSLGNVLWQKGSGPVLTGIIDKFPLATESILKWTGGPISDYTTVVNPESTNSVLDSPITIAGETFPTWINLSGDTDVEWQSSLQINVASDSTVYLICRSYHDAAHIQSYISIDGVINWSVRIPNTEETPLFETPLLTAGVHTISSSNGMIIWGIAGDLVEQNSQ